MTAFWKIAIVTCAVLIGGASISWEVHRVKTNSQELAAAAEACRVPAEHGNAGAESSLGNFYYHGQGVPQDYAQAFLWYGKAANQNDARAQRGLGFMYQNGLGVTQDTTEALSWYRKAADQGDAKAQNALGLIYDEGQGIPQDYAEALRWYCKGVDQGYPMAQYNLGNMYFYGRGVPRNRAEADRLYHQAAAQGDEYAQRVLGLRGKGLSTWVVLSLIVISVWYLFFLKDFHLDEQRPRTPRRRALIVAALLGLAYIVLSLIAAFGVFPSLFIANTVSFARNLMIGTTLGILIPLWGPKTAKLVLGISVALLVAFNLIAFAHREPAALPSAFHLFWSANGLLLGLLIASAILFRLPIRKDAEIAAN